MAASYFSKIVCFFYLCVLALLGRSLREFDLDYVAAVAIVGFALFVFPLFRIKLDKWDLIWVPSILFATFYLCVYALDVGLPADPIIQSLIFFMPLVALVSRNICVESVDLGKFFFYLACMCVVGMIPYYSEVIYALTSSFERARFHTYFSISLCFILVAFLLAGWISGKVKVVITVLIIVVFSGAAAHRSMYLAFVLQVVYWSVASGRAKDLLRPAVAIALGIGVLFLTDFGGVILGKFVDSVAGGDGNTESRLYYYGQVLFNSYRDFFGVGFGEYFKYGYDSKGQPVSYALQHNSFLSYLYFLGWIPFLAITVGVVRLHFLRRLTERLKVYITIFVGMSFFSALNVYLEQPTFGLLYWMLFGLIVREIKYARQTT